MIAESEEAGAVTQEDESNPAGSLSPVVITPIFDAAQSSKPD